MCRGKGWNWKKSGYAKEAESRLWFFFKNALDTYYCARRTFAGDAIKQLGLCNQLRSKLKVRVTRRNYLSKVLQTWTYCWNSKMWSGIMRQTGGPCGQQKCFLKQAFIKYWLNSFDFSVQIGLEEVSPHRECTLKLKKIKPAGHTIL